MRRVLSFLFGWCFIIVCVVFSIKSTALNPNFYIPKYEEMELASDIGVSKKDLNQSILDYLDDKRDDIKGHITWYGVSQETFNEKETSHMVDVKVLYQNALIVAKMAFIILGLVVLYFYLNDKTLMFAYLSKGFLMAMFTFILMLVFFGFWILTDFTSFWTWFHTIFFSNQLWLLDPNTDFMICMLPETIFYKLVLACVVKVICFMALASVLAIYYMVKKAPIGFER